MKLQQISSNHNEAIKKIFYDANGVIEDYEVDNINDLNLSFQEQALEDGNKLYELQQNIEEIENKIKSMQVSINELKEKKRAA